MPERVDAFDVITDPKLARRTASLRRNLAMRLAAQNAYDTWYSYDDPKELAKALKPNGEKAPAFEPSRVMAVSILELSSSIDSEMLRVLRDVGVGSPQFGVPGMGIQTHAPSTGPNAGDVPSQGRKRGLFG